MAEYNFSDINEAKKRVREMQNRSRSPVPEEKGESLLQMLIQLEDGAEAASVLALLYLMQKEKPSPALLSVLLNFLL